MLVGGEYTREAYRAGLDSLSTNAYPVEGVSALRELLSSDERKGGLLSEILAALGGKPHLEAVVQYEGYLLGTFGAGVLMTLVVSPLPSSTGDQSTPPAYCFPGAFGSVSFFLQTEEPSIVGGPGKEPPGAYDLPHRKKRRWEAPCSGIALFQRSTQRSRHLPVCRQRTPRGGPP